VATNDELLKHSASTLWKKKREGKGKPVIARFTNSLQTSSKIVGSIVGRPLKSAVVKRSICLHGHRTSLSVEDDFWNGLLEIAHREKTSVQKLVEQIDRDRMTVNLSSAIRMFVFNYLRAAPEVSLPDNAIMLEPVVAE
jgi:predicted DNA-binding ribbon-helix-helix protein